MISLRKNQEEAITISVKNDFQSGTHFHATGSGKTIIALEIIKKFNDTYPKKNILWLCEFKHLISQTFLKEKNPYHLDLKKRFLILDYTQHKQPDWYMSVNTAKYWGRPVLLLINRAFLVSNNNYQRIQSPIGLIIHDECHTIQNKTTCKFYQWIQNKWGNCRCIGFTATPNHQIAPYNTLLSKYSILQSYLDNIIVNPHIVWIKSKVNLDNQSMGYIIKYLMKKHLVYHKVVVWCGMIEYCYQLALLWKQIFPQYKICIDTSQNDTHEDTPKTYGNYQDFSKLENYGILFCASKHREGSDIYHLDGCIFLDKVEKRNHKVFAQSLGRVVRKDKEGNKQQGLMIDFNAKNTLNICDRLNKYLHIPPGIFPWKYDNKKVRVHTINKNIIIHSLQFKSINKLQNEIQKEKEDKIQKQLTNLDGKKEYHITTSNNNNQCENNGDLMEFTLDNGDIKYLKNGELLNSKNEKKYSLQDLIPLFVRECPDDRKYTERLYLELDLIVSKELIGYLIKARDILNMTKNIPHVTRGSCGSSLVCYLLGISNTDPVKYKISFARFLNEYRDNLPDIDFDFPHIIRDDVFMKLQMKWKNKVARISNHIYYHEKSALREAIRREGIHTFFDKYSINSEVKKMPYDAQSRIRKEARSLEDTFRCYSLHCGGIIFFPEGIPEELIKEDRKFDSLSQVVLNKVDVAKYQNFKIDILSSRALSQLYSMDKSILDFNDEKILTDSATAKLLAEGHNIGITLGESPLIRKAFINVKPKGVEDIALCLAIIRPAAKEARKDYQWDNKFVYDDDAIKIIKDATGCSEGYADKLRRGIAKGKKEDLKDFKQLVRKNGNKVKPIMEKIKNMRKYSFCKSHAYSYGQLVWYLAYFKAHYPKKFWKSALSNCDSSYRKWVHYYEAKCAGISYKDDTLKKQNISIYASNRRKKIKKLSYEQQLREYGYWEMENDTFFPGCYFRVNVVKEGEENKSSNESSNKSSSSNVEFKGIIASQRMLRNYENKDKPNIVFFLGVKKGLYIELLIEECKGFSSRKYIGISGLGKVVDEKIKSYKAINYQFF